MICNDAFFSYLCVYNLKSKMMNNTQSANINRRQIIRSLLSGFFPLLVFIIADELFDLIFSLLIALGVSFLQLLLIYIREKRLDKFVIMDSVLIMSLGAISYAFNSPIFILIKPAIIESVFISLIAVTLFTGNPVLINMSRRYLGGMQLDKHQVHLMRKMLKGLFWLILIHVSLIIASAVYVGDPESNGYLERKELWAFISGGLLYILLGISFAYQYIRGKIKQAKFLQQYKDDEWFDIVTPQGKPVGKAPRSLCHGNPNLLHPVIHVHVFNSNGDLWLQKRAQNKVIQPGLWDTSVGGHVMHQESIEQALQREIQEELGIVRLPHEPLFRYVMKNNIESELVYTFRGIHNGPFQYPQNEIEMARFWPIDEIKENLNKGIFTPNFEQEFELLQKLKHLQ